MSGPAFSATSASFFRSRAVPVVEAAAAIAIFDMILGNTQTDRRK